MESKRTEVLRVLISFEAQKTGEAKDVLEDKLHRKLVDRHPTSEPSTTTTCDSSDDTGGWGTDVETEMVSSHCDIEERWDSISAEDFYTQYLLPGRPVMLRGLAARQKWAVRQKWTKENLLKQYGSLRVMTGPVPYGKQFGLKQRRGKLATILKEAGEGKGKVDEAGNPYYIFTDVADDDSDSANKLKSDYPFRPEFLNHNHPSANYTSAHSHQFFVGGIGQGAPVHFHGDAWNVCVYGQRRWFLFPPSTAIYSNVPTKQWLAEDYPNLTPEQRPLECMQRGGDVIFVPSMFGHGTYTVQESVGVAVELEGMQNFFLDTISLQLQS